MKQLVLAGWIVTASPSYDLNLDHHSSSSVERCLLWMSPVGYQRELRRVILQSVQEVVKRIFLVVQVEWLLCRNVSLKPNSPTRILHLHG